MVKKTLHRMDPFKNQIRYFRLDRRDLCYVKFILEAYDGMSTVSTADAREGVISVTIPLPFAADMAGLLESLGQEVAMTEVLKGEGWPPAEPAGGQPEAGGSHA